MGEPDEPPLRDRVLTWSTLRTSNQNTSSTSLPNKASNDAQRSLNSKPSANTHNVHQDDFDAHDTIDAASSTLPPPAPPPEEPAKEGAPLDRGPNAPVTTRLRAGCKRFAQHTYDALTHSWINVLLIFVPIGIAMNYVPLPQKTKPTIVFAMNAVAIVPLAGLLAHATESVASRMGDTWASLLNVTFGNAVELIIFIIALAKDQIPIVQASILGSILANLLLILGMAFLFGGLRFREQIYNSTVTQMSACLLSLSVTSLLLPTAFHASFSDGNIADTNTLKISRGTSVVLLLVYVLYLLFQLKSHAYMYESTPQAIIDEESHPGVLAEIMNSSSSDDSDSSSSSSSGSSTNSHNTAKQRIKRAFRHRKHRKSSTSSTAATSSPSGMTSPAAEKRSVRSVRDEPSPSPRFENHTSFPFSGDEADTDGEHDPPVSRIRDFGSADPAVPQKLSTKLAERAGRKKHKKKSSEKKKTSSKKSKSQHGDNELVDIDEKTTSVNFDQVSASPDSTEPPRVGFAAEDQVEEIPAANTAKRPFSVRQISRPNFRAPPLPSLLSNTVFTMPQPRGPYPGQPAALSIARGRSSHRVNSNGPRRTSSLPDRLNRPSSSTRPPVATASSMAAHSPGVAAPDQSTTEKKEEPPAGDMSRTAAIVLLLCTTGLVAFCAELLVDAIPEMVEDTTVSQAFIGLIILPIVGNAAEHVTAVTVAAKNKMDLAIGVAVGSSIQIALFVTPLVVLLGWIMDKDMTLYFNLFETISLFVTAFVVNFLVLDGRSNYLEGSLLIAAYIIIALAAFFYPDSNQESSLGGGNNDVASLVSSVKFRL